MRRLLLALTLAGGGLAALASPSGAAVIDCRARVDFNLYVVKARNMSCGAARFEMRRYHGSIARTFHTAGGFYCYRVSGNRLSGEWRCVRAAKAFRFDFSD